MPVWRAYPVASGGGAEARPSARVSLAQVPGGEQRVGASLILVTDALTPSLGERVQVDAVGRAVTGRHPGETLAATVLVDANNGG